MNKDNNKKPLNFRACSELDIDKATVPIPLEVSMNGKNYILFGEQNDMPQIYFDCYTDCSILQSAINSVVDYMTGNGMTGTPDQVINRQGETLLELIKKTALDYIIFGAFSIQVIRNKMGEIAELNWIDVRNVRLNEDGDKVWYTKNWGRYNRNIKCYDRFNQKTMVPNSIFYFKSVKSRTIYGNPIWGAALRDVLTLTEASQQNYNNILNQFTPNVILSFNNGVPDSDTQDEIEDLVIRKFTGNNGNKIMLTWSDSKETAPELSTFQTEDYTNKYITVMNASQNNILAAFRMSAQLAGISTQATGFSNIEYSASFKVFKTTVIRPLQTEIEQAFSKLGYDFTLNEFNINFDDENQNTLS